MNKHQEQRTLARLRDGLSYGEMARLEGVSEAEAIGLCQEYLMGKSEEREHRAYADYLRSEGFKK